MFGEDEGGDHAGLNQGVEHDGAAHAETEHDPDHRQEDDEQVPAGGLRIFAEGDPHRGEH